MGYLTISMGDVNIFLPEVKRPENFTLFQKIDYKGLKMVPARPPNPMQIYQI